MELLPYFFVWLLLSSWVAYTRACTVFLMVDSGKEFIIHFNNKFKNITFIVAFFLWPLRLLTSESRNSFFHSLSGTVKMDILDFYLCLKYLDISKYINYNFKSTR